MIYAQIIPEDRELLESEMKAAKDAKWYRRLKIIELSSQGKTVLELANLFGVSKATIRDYIHRYNEGGIGNLCPKRSPGRPVKIPLSKAEFEELLHQSPCQFDKLDTAVRNWTQELLIAYFEMYHDLKVTQSAISKRLKQLGLRWNRGKLKVTSPDPLYTLKRERINELKKSP